MVPAAAGFRRARKRHGGLTMKDSVDVEELVHTSIQLCCVVVAIMLAVAALRDIERAIRELRVEVRITEQEEP